MNLELVPESAPFSSEQRAWLNGFLSGVLGLIDSSLTQGSKSNPEVVSIAKARDGGFATQVAAEALQSPSPSKLAADEVVPSFPWHDSTLPILDRIRLAEGQSRELRLMAAMAQLNCGSCGYLCQSYAEAIANGTEKNLMLCSPGGSETAKMLRKLVKEPSITEVTTANRVATTTTSNAKVEDLLESGSRSKPVPAVLVSSERLNGRESRKDTRHVVLDLQATKLRYRVGDALGVYPTNCAQLVERFIAAAKLDPNAIVMVQGNRIGLQEALARRCLRSIPFDLVEAAIQIVKERPKRNGQVRADESIVQNLQSFAESEEMGEFDCIEFLELFISIPWTPQVVVEALQPLQPRLYSIASSQSLYPNEVHLTVSRVENVVRNRTRKGVASTMLSDRLTTGEKLDIFVHKSHGFTIPSDPKAPMIMVGPGTGIAPFIAFLQQREADRAEGKNWLFFGDQRQELDFLYRDQLSEWLKKGLLSRLDLAFSRDTAEKVYVQHRMRENGRELFSWLESGAYFYVCGDARRMAVDVENTLLDVIETQGSMTKSQAKDYLTRLKQHQRYIRDVY